MQRPRRNRLSILLLLSAGYLLLSLHTWVHATTPSTGHGQTRKSSFYLVQRNNVNFHHRRVVGENKVATPYIIDGTQVPKGSFPFFVNSFNGNSLCGGTLIHSDVILTSAHCHGAFNKGLLLGGGDVEQPLAQVKAAGLFLTINLQRPHPGFSQWPDLINDDIMVLRLETPISSVTPVVLNTDPDVPTDNGSCIAIGHGRTDNDITSSSGPSKELLQAEMEVLPQEECIKKLSSFDNIIVKEDILCATNANNQTNSSICQGDSGGPLLLVNDRIPQVIQVGVTSFSEECRSHTIPNGFSRVSTFDDWIQEQICDISVDPPASCPKANNTDPDDGISVEIVFKHDANPEETTWSIRDRRDNKIVFAGPEYVARPGDEWSTIVHLPLGPYFMEIFDSAGDGLGWPGSIVIQTVVTDEYPNGRVLMDELAGGTFRGARIQLPFVVVDPTSQTLAPSSAPSKEILPTVSPIPSMTPTPAPTDRPTVTPSPTEQPTVFPTVTLTLAPTGLPSERPPTEAPSVAPSFLPSAAPSPVPSNSAAPTTVTEKPTRSPYPTTAPSEESTPFPTRPRSRETEPVAELPFSSPETSGMALFRSLSTLTLLIVSAIWNAL